MASDGTPSALRDVLDRLERASIEAERVTVRTPDLDEVFLALTDDPADHPVDGHPGDRSLDRAGDRRGGDRR